MKNTADRPVAKLDFANFVTNPGSPGDPAAQTVNRSLLATPALHLDGSVLVNTRALVEEALKNPGLFSSEELVEQGNTLPLIPLNIDPSEHVKYRKLLDPLFAPRRIDAL